MRVERTFWLLAGFLLCSAVRAPATTFPEGTLEVTAEPVQPEGAPVIFTFTVHNTGTVPITYWRAGPGDYPDAADFFAWVAPGDTPRQGKPATLSNGQSSDAPGHSEQIPPGTRKTFHAAMQPRDPGVYHIAFSCDADGRHSGGYLKVVQWPAMHTLRSVQVQIRDDAALASQFDKFTITGVRANDPFAAHLARTWTRPAVREAMLNDLAGTDPIAAGRAVEALWQSLPLADDQPPNDLAPAIANVIVQRLKPAADGLDAGLMRRLVNAAGQLQGVEITGALERVLAERPNGSVGEKALHVIEEKQRGVFFDRNYTTRTPHKEDPAVLEALIRISRSGNARARKVAFVALEEYSTSPAAWAALRAGTSDPDHDARYEAMMALYRNVKSPTTEP